MGGRGGGVCAPSPLSPASPARGYRVLSCSDLMIRAGRPWNRAAVGGPWTFFVAALDKVQYNRHLKAAQADIRHFVFFTHAERALKKCLHMLSVR